MMEEIKVVVFQGDSITDCGRDRTQPEHYGRGYAHLAAAYLQGNYPGKYVCYNKGISGNRVVDLYARIKIDMINLKPDYMSILIGINDVWHEYSSKNGVDAPKFERVYGMLVEELKEALPDLKIMIMEPFVLPGTATCTNEANPGRWEYFTSECVLRQQAAKRVAEKYGLLYVPLQAMLDAACTKAPADYWLFDGVHPTPAGNELIKQAWLKAFETLA